MMEVETDDSDEHRRYVDRRVLIEDLTDQELIGELITRERLLVVTAKRMSWLKDHKTDPDYMADMQHKLTEDIGSYMSTRGLVSHDVVYQAATMLMQYTAICVMLTVLPEENIV